MGLFFLLALGIPVVSALIALPFVMRGRVRDYHPRYSPE
jgi:hypothetical protein